MVRLRSAGLSRTYRRNLREAGFWLLALVQRLGKTITRDDPPHVVDRWLERAVDAAYQDGEKLYLVNLGIVAIQRTLKLSAPSIAGCLGCCTGLEISPTFTLQGSPYQIQIPMSYTSGLI